MKKRLGNFFLLFGLILMVLFFSSATLNDVIYFFAGLALISLGFLLKRSPRPRRSRRRSRKKSIEKMDLENEND